MIFLASWFQNCRYCESLQNKTTHTEGCLYTHVESAMFPPHTIVFSQYQDFCFFLKNNLKRLSTCFPGRNWNNKKNIKIWNFEKTKVGLKEYVSAWKIWDSFTFSHSRHCTEIKELAVCFIVSTTLRKVCLYVNYISVNHAVTWSIRWPNVYVKVLVHLQLHVCLLWFITSVVRWTCTTVTNEKKCSL
jgi:hypothetical protein